MRINIDINVNVGKVVRSFVLVDLALLGGWGLIDPIFSIYIIKNVAGATLVTIGTAATIYWLLKSALQIPLSKFLDRTPGEKDDFYALLASLFVLAVTAFLFNFIHTTWQLYLVEGVRAIGFALYSASWPAIFSRHLDKERVSFDWALDSTSVGIGAATGGFFGGILAQHFGFQIVFTLGAVLSLISAFILLLTPEFALPRRTKNIAEPLRDHVSTPAGK